MLTMRGFAVVWGKIPKVMLIELDLPSVAGEKPELRVVKSLTKGHSVAVDDLSMDKPNRGMLALTTQDSIFTGELEKLLWQGGLSWVYWDAQSTTTWLRGDIL